MINIYDTANQMERELRETEQYKAVLEAKGKVENDSTAKALYEEYKTIQQEMHAKMMSGEMPTEDDQKKMQEFSEKIDANESVVELLKAQQALGMLADEIQRIVFGNLNEVF
ncbi:Cell fate regulator YlbF, YheA/YmcA/DUF963 family (controls sporulation, competence, biofilm development) [Pilibacter termitis]|uniref:UPF0342 protein SAMN02745116_00584 n=1 Tax=Pilibacter termitis TaxID=263852 RepID=A0A1T4L9W9_9ENTE|nr:YlbF family regulator [Pilibacter termitis]SJZ51539.1 Cell fate regulator YlbF, YheA/YmcA/DUF963 family (controls sporulation, competence, biofilm development) [Pilibacter termitis]